MGYSLQYYLLKACVFIKGVKRNFSKDPIDYEKIRNTDVHHPRSRFFNGEKVKRFSVADTLITQLQKDENQKHLIVFVHGGAFVSGPSMIHWDVVEKIYKQSNHTIWFCDYPKSPECSIEEISNNIDFVYQRAIQKYDPNNIIMLGDSVGGTLIMALVQRLVFNKIPVPGKLMLVSPVCDATFSNPDITLLEKKDILLGLKGVRSAKRMAAKNISLEDSIISPINGSFKFFPKTILFLAENDITFPDQVLLANKLMFTNVDHRVVIGRGMPHMWAFLPLMPEAKKALNDIIREINADYPKLRGKGKYNKGVLKRVYK